tara:strand:+ start:20165 stop:21025 length:861 start_codon:yes stop_codon:yes gene_type:complete
LIGSLRKLGFYLKNKKNIYLIDSDKELNFLIQSLKDEKIVGIDTEFDWRRTYFPKLSLLQIVVNRHIFLVDCLKELDLSFLKNTLENDKLVIFHSSRSDSTALSTNLDITIKKSFDIQIAEKVLRGGNSKSYASIVRYYYSINLNKSETNSNWLRRPLSDEQLRYASNDVLFLLDIFKRQKKELLKKKLYDQVIVSSENETNLGNQSLKSNRLKKQGQKISKRKKQIFLWREEIAESENVPPSFIFKDKNLRILSELDPDDKDAKIKIMRIIGDSRLTNLFISDIL